MRVLICFLCGGRRSLHFFDVPRYPRLVDRGFRRAVKSQDNEVSLAWNRREPVVLVAFRGFGTEINSGRAIGILFRFVAGSPTMETVDRWRVPRRSRRHTVSPTRNSQREYSAAD